MSVEPWGEQITVLTGNKGVGVVRGLRTVATIGIAALAGSAVTGYVVAHRPEPRPSMPRLISQTLVPRTEIDLPQAWTTPARGECDSYTFRAPVPQGNGTSEGGEMTIVPFQDPKTSFNVVCVGPIDATGTPEEHVLAIGTDPRAHVSRIVVGPFGSALRTESTMGANVLTEWWTERDGMLWVAGYLHHPDDLTLLPTVEAMLASWKWS